MEAKDWSQHLTAYIDGELADAEARELEEALTHDVQLRELEQRLRASVRAVESLPAPVSDVKAMRARVLAEMQRATEAEGAAGFWERWFSVPRFAAGLAALAAIAVVLRIPREERLEETQLAMSQHFDEVEDLDIAGLDAAEDIELVASLHELEVQ